MKRGAGPAIMAAVLAAAVHSGRPHVRDGRAYRPRTPEIDPVAKEKYRERFATKLLRRRLKWLACGGIA